LSHAANLRKEIAQLLDIYVEESSDSVPMIATTRAAQPAKAASQTELCLG
jgi:hypothetical protein